MSPKEIVKQKSLDEFCGDRIEVEDEDDGDTYSLVYGGPPYRLGSFRYREDQGQYENIHKHFLARLLESDITPNEFIENSESSKLAPKQDMQGQSAKGAR